jgi:hypothetical protein
MNTEGTLKTITRRTQGKLKESNGLTLMGREGVMNKFSENEISRIVFDCALEIHRALGPGLLESAYQNCLKYELEKAGLNV